MLTKSIKLFIHREPVLCIAALMALLSIIIVPPSFVYAEYIDLRVLCLLFCLMAVIAGFQDCGLFELMAKRMLTGEKTFRRVSILLVLLPFFSSMLVTNDVSLIAFVPFTVFVLNKTGRQDARIRIIVLQTVAANLGSMATPVGNPQNLFLYAHYSLGIGDFLSLLLPLTLVSLLLLTGAAALGGGERVSIAFAGGTALKHKKRFAVYAVLFVLCLLSVLRVLPYGILTAIVAVSLIIVSPRLLRRVDYGLLLTFVCFFIFSGNLGQLPAVHEALSRLISGNTLLCSALVSQGISNVPAAVLLSGLTSDWRGLLAGVDVGGLGTPVASLASLISMKYYFTLEDHRAGRYILFFTLVNAVGLAILLPIAALIV
ncbi:MAG: citrate transporter [Oscillospiraceae bacterium]|nr:citrate transporter [Oscillospiraceae bacterium]